jgi:hypothetical protein
MMNAGMRLAAPSFFMGMSCLSISYNFRDQRKRNAAVKMTDKHLK